MSETRRLRAFLCHASEDKTVVRELSGRLRVDGVDPWFDEDSLMGGEVWREAIQKAVRESDVVLVCLSYASTTKTGYVQKEVKLALDAADERPQGAIYLIPVKLTDKCDIPERLKEFHCLNLNEEHGYSKLLETLATRAESLNLAGPTRAARAVAQAAWLGSVDATPATVRSEGCSEVVGDIVLAVPASAVHVSGPPWPSFDVRVRLTQNITSPLVAGNYTSALLTTDRGNETDPVCCFGRRLTNDEIAFEGVPIVAVPGGGNRILRISDLRANVQAAGDFGTVFASVGMIPCSPGAAAPVLRNAILPVANAAPGFVSRLAAVKLSSSRGLNPELITEPSSARPAVTFAIHFAEGFPGAFRTRDGETGQAPLPPPGLRRGTALSASQGTRFMLRLWNVPAGVQVFVTTRDIPASAQAAPSVRAVLTRTDRGGAGPFLAADADPTGVATTNDGIPLLTVPSSGLAVWEWTGGTRDSVGSSVGVAFGVVLAAIPGQARLGEAKISTALAPVTTICTMSPVAPVPRFVDRSTDISAFCVEQ